MKKVLLLVIASFFVTGIVISQPVTYSVANAHSHNDYEQLLPFYTAYNAGFGSIEADIFLQNGELLVAHSKEELVFHRTLDSLYLQPLLHCVKRNNGFAYADTLRKLQMMIDIKTDAVITLQKLIQVIEQYPELSRNASILWVISGERPAADQFVTYPSFVFLMARLQKNTARLLFLKLLC